MERKTFQQGMTYLATAFDTELKRERAAVYWDQLGGLRDEPFLRAVKAAVAHHKRFPTIADLREHYRDALRQMTVCTFKLTHSAPVDQERVASMVRKLREQLR